MQTVAIGFYDEKHLVSSFIRDVCSRKPGLKIYFTARDEPALLESLRRKIPDVLLMNLTRKIRPGNSLIKKIKTDFPELKIAGFVYGTELSQQEVFSMINAGVSSILTDAHSVDDVFTAIQRLMENGFHLNEVVNEAMFSYCKRNRILRRSFGPEEKFSEREIKILEGKRSGKTSMELAGDLCVSKKTIDGILHDLYTRFECKNFNELLGKYDHQLFG